MCRPRGLLVLLLLGAFPGAASALWKVKGTEEKQHTIAVQEGPNVVPLDALKLMRAEMCANLLHKIGKEFNTDVGGCLTFMKQICRPGKDLSMDGDNKRERSTGQGYCKLFFPGDDEPSPAEEEAEAAEIEEEQAKQKQISAEEEELAAHKRAAEAAAAERAAMKRKAAAEAAAEKRAAERAAREAAEREAAEKAAAEQAAADKAAAEAAAKEAAEREAAEKAAAEKAAAEKAAAEKAAAEQAAAEEAASSAANEGAGGAGGDASGAGAGGGGSAAGSGGEAEGGSGVGAGGDGSGAGGDGSGAGSGAGGPPSPASMSAPGPSSFNPEWWSEMSAGNDVAEQGFQGGKVSHKNMKTFAGDWQSEYGHYQMDMKSICKEHPSNVWCVKQHFTPDALSSPVDFRAAGVNKTQDGAPGDNGTVEMRANNATRVNRTVGLRAQTAKKAKKHRHWQASPSSALSPGLHLGLAIMAAFMFAAR